LLKGPQTWFSKNAPEDIKAKGEKAFANGLLDTLKQIEGYFGAAFRNYHTNVLILRNLYIFGLFNEIYRNIYDVLKEQNTMLLSETTEAIHRIIDGSDVPFIYEKIGNRFDHFMLDEFQDTSVLQWDNFIPLLRNSLASDNYNMIVGDVKQSIYRWRGSDWNTLDTGINKDFREDQLKYPPLSDNYRSGKEIVRFNGDFFTSINLDEKISEIYKGARQTAKKQFDGHIKVNYLDGNSKEFKERSLVLLKEQLDRLTKELHYPQSSIAVLTRANSEAKIVAETLISYGYDVISEESLTLSSSSTVTGLLSILKALLYPEDTRNVLLLGQLGIDVGLLELDLESEEGSLYNLCEALLRKAFPSIPEGEIVYVNAFLDLVLDYQITNGSNTAGFLDWWKETGFKKTLTMPDMADAVKVFTIHKSKGLEMDVVILPFFNIKLARENNSNVYLWCTPPEQLSQMGIVPLKFVSGMEKSLFDKEYEQELLYTQIDAVNTAYVAMTRPKTELIINAPLNTNRQAVSDLLLDYLKGQFGEQDSYEIGTELDYETYLSLSASNREDTESASGKLQVRITENGSFPIHGESGRLKMAYLAADFFEDSNRIKGIVLHDIMSAVYTPDDLPTAVSSAVREGKLSEEDSARVLQKLSSRINSHPEWYDGSMQVLNELTIVSTDGSAERPDRVLIDGDRAIVIDYKFGGEDSKYKFQVLRYMHSLKKMGYKNVKGYIWYLVDDIIENVE
ncbi:MAG: UvrD-helicase domain-containing protein, partial [Bacteroidales bacterium]|nr:UvrD-helicase domain-containing protein [Bacteroidales bacterium]